ncbi:MAG TPA: Txe/YoeB family addiction module toxin [Chitinophagaceae bacterium]
MDLVFQTHAWEDYLYWQEQDKKVFARINDLIKDCRRSPLKGLGKPQKGDLSGCWSRRITDEHRLVYTVWEKRLHILQCRFHYQ